MDTYRAMIHYSWNPNMVGPEAMYSNPHNLQFLIWNSTVVKESTAVPLFATPTSVHLAFGMIFPTPNYVASANAEPSSMAPGTHLRIGSEQATTDIGETGRYSCWNLKSCDKPWRAIAVPLAAALLGDSSGTVPENLRRQRKCAKFLDYGNIRIVHRPTLPHCCLAGSSTTGHHPTW